MSNRRSFLKSAAAGVIFAGCEFTRSAQAFQAPKRRQVTVRGKRVRTVDLHAHIRITEVRNLVKDIDHGKGLERLLAVPDAKLDSHSVDARQGARRSWERVAADDDQVGLQRLELVEHFIRISQFEVHMKRQPSVWSQRGQVVGGQGQVGDVMPVHHIKMKRISAGAFSAPYFLAHSGVICG